ncbi:amine oxidase protein (plasmid) [Rhizobium etli 8C-3]|uniref:Tryptophan 2-monooxygenase n=2 Tax=Rhizobium TaxID=379 RepID=A0A4R3R3N3_9HYPH|nr:MULTISPECIES: NAD(P)/FAD-dependent oxidoreductase [Rhizobium]APO79256.1 amine oxidase protein [Rhizobium etli 8C-3]TCU29221.1 monoamine oxidase [Rhizobium azibense]TCU37862.1 monoamine oxidase [Rhizobium azibense]
MNGNEVDVAIIGAGAAGIAAGRHIMATRPDLCFVVLEASARIGGRARTEHFGAGLGALDVGCGWLHGARTNAWTAIAQDLGLTIDETRAPWDEGGRRLDTNAEARSAIGALEAFFERINSHEGEDKALSSMLQAGGKWNEYVHAVGAFITGAGLDRSSVVDLQRYEPGPGPDWRVREGYGTVVSAYAGPLAIELQTAVERIDHRAADHVVISTSKGQFRVKAVIVTVSTNVLASERIAFIPPLPEKIDAASRLPLGLANKLFMKVESPHALPLDSHLLGSYRERRTGAYQIRPLGNPVVEGYYAGDLAYDLELGGPNEAFQFALGELKRALGSDIGRQLSLISFSAWSSDPHIGGSYSYASPGASNLRRTLAAPLDNRIFFAGEACSAKRYSTAHGAFDTGVTAAQELMKTIA